MKRPIRNALWILGALWCVLAVVALCLRPGQRLFPLVELGCISCLILRLALDRWIGPRPGADRDRPSTATPEERPRPPSPGK